MKAKSYRPVAFELMQYFYTQTHEPLIHARIRLSAPLDAQTLSDAITASIPYVPLLGCVFSPHPLFPRWIDRGFTGREILHILTCSEEEEKRAAQSAMTASIDIETEPQMRVTLLRSGNTDTLCLLINHMVCDGAGFKQYLALLSRHYADLSAGRPVPKAAATIRSAKHLFSPLRPGQFFRVLTHDYPKLTQAEALRVSIAENGQPPRIVTHEMTGESLNKIKRYARENGATVNDVLLAAYARALAGKTGETQISLPCPVDLRKYLAKADTLSVCNLTVNYVVALAIHPETPFLETLLEVHRQISEQKRSDNCLKSVLLMGIWMHAVPFFLMNKRFSRAFTMPVVSYTNLGVLEEKTLMFGEAHAVDAFLTGAIKRAPYFQLAISTFGGVMTLSSDLYGSEQAVAETEKFLATVADEAMRETA